MTTTSLSREDVPLLHLKKTVNEGAKSAFAPICRQTAAPRADLRSVGRSVRPSVRRSSLSSFLSPLFFAALQQKRHSRSSVAVGRSMQAHRGRERQRGSSQAAYQRNFLGVIDRPLPPLSRRPPSLSPPLSPSLFLSLPRSFPPPRPTTRAEPRTLRKNERTFLVGVSPGKKSGRISERNIILPDT